MFYKFKVLYTYSQKSFLNKLQNTCHVNMINYKGSFTPLPNLVINRQPIKGLIVHNLNYSSPSVFINLFDSVHKMAK